MLERAFQHVSDDFHVAVRMHRKAAPSGDAVVVHYTQGAEVHMFRVVVIGKRKGEMRVQPAVVGVAALVALENADHDWPPWYALLTLMIVLVITTIVKRCIGHCSLQPISAFQPLEST